MAAIGIATATAGTVIVIAIRAADPSAAPSAASPAVANPVSSLRMLLHARTPAALRRPPLPQRARRARIARSAPTVPSVAGVAGGVAVAAGAAAVVVRARPASDSPQSGRLQNANPW
jgi:hypothetical protein